MEIILLFVILSQTLYSIYRDYINSQEKNKLVNALLSKTAQDMVEFERADKLKVGETTPTLPDLTSLDEMPQDAWEKMVINDEK